MAVETVCDSAEQLAGEKVGAMVRRLVCLKVLYSAVKKDFWMVVQLGGKSVVAMVAYLVLH